MGGAIERSVVMTGDSLTSYEGKILLDTVTLGIMKCGWNRGR
jgi:hypothetical protein